MSLEELRLLERGADWSILLSPTTYHLPPITYHLSPITYHLPPTTYHLSPTTYYLSSITYHLLSITYHLSSITSHLSPITYNLSLNNGGRWGATDDFTTSFLRFSSVLHCPLGLSELQACPFCFVFAKHALFPPSSIQSVRVNGASVFFSLLAMMTIIVENNDKDNY